jgi:hypothetical protein
MILSDRWLYFFSQQLECVKCRKKRRRYVYEIEDGTRVNGREFTIEALANRVDKMDVWCESCTPSTTRKVISAGRLKHKEEAAKYATIKAHSQIASSYDAQVLPNGYVISKRGLSDKLKNTPCMLCGMKYPAPAMDFHHVVDKKVAEINAMVNKPYSLEDMVVELRKCIVLCAVCHRLVHSKNPPDISEIPPIVLSDRFLKSLSPLDKKRKV